MSKRFVMGKSASGLTRWRVRVTGLAVLACLVATIPVGAQDSGQDSGRVEFVTPNVRNVTPSRVQQWPGTGEPLVRDAPRQDEEVPEWAARQSSAPAPAPSQVTSAAWHRFYLAKSVDAATFEVDGVTIRISGVTPPDLSATCNLADGKTWPCGRASLHALRMLVRGRAVECYFPASDSLEEIIAPCRVGRGDIGLWLAGQGWASANNLATDEYREAEHKARCTGAGVWRDAPPDASCEASVVER